MVTERKHGICITPALKGRLPFLLWIVRITVILVLCLTTRHAANGYYAKHNLGATDDRPDILESQSSDAQCNIVGYSCGKNDGTFLNYPLMSSDDPLITIANTLKETS